MLALYLYLFFSWVFVSVFYFVFVFVYFVRNSFLIWSIRPLTGDSIVLLRAELKSGDGEGEAGMTRDDHQ